MEYQTILTIKESKKATVELAAIDGHIGPVVIKKLRGVNPDIYRLLCHVQNSHIPQIFEYEAEGDELIVAEEYVDGENLEEYLTNNQLSDKEKISLALQLCEAVEFLHSMEPPVIHRDIKPSNILITGKKVLKLIDFDASRQYKEENTGDTRLLGTLEYAPPEQFGYSQTDVRSDIYSMGVVFHEIELTENKRVAELWEKITEKCTSFDPENRYQSVKELVRDIKDLLSGKKRVVRKICKFIGAAGLLGVILGMAMILPKQGKDAENAVVTEAPVITEPPVVTEAPVMTEPPVVTEAPVMTEPPVVTEPPVITEPPVATEAPVITEPPVATEAPVITEPPVVTEVPVITEPPVATEAPVITEPPAEYHFYKDLSENTEVILQKDFFDDFVEISGGSCYHYATKETIDIPVDMLENGPGYVRIADEFMLQLEPGVCQMDIYFSDGEDSSGVSLKKVVEVHPEGEQPERTEAKLMKNTGDFYYDYPRSVAVILSSDTESRINGFYYRYSNPTDWAELERLQAWCYEIVCDGKVLIIRRDYLQEILTNVGHINVVAACEDGSLLEVQINILPGIPEGVSASAADMEETLVPKTTSMSNLYPNLDKVPGEIWYSYYQSYGTDLIMSDDTYKEYTVLESAVCYCFQTGLSVEIPKEMLDLGNGYVKISEQFMLSLSPYIYQFSFSYNGEVGGSVIYEKTVKIYSEGTKKISADAKLLKGTQTVYSEYPGTVTNIVRTGKDYRITGAYIYNKYRERIEFKPDQYRIDFDGRMLSISGEYFLPYYDQGNITLYITLDNGSTWEMEIEFMPGMPEVYYKTKKTLSEIEYHYYKYYPADLIVPDESYKEYEVFDYATCYCFRNAETAIVPEDALEIRESYIRISEQFMLSLEPAAYEFVFYYKGVFKGNNAYKITVQVHSEEERGVPDDGTKLVKSERTIYSACPGEICNVVGNGERSRIERAYILNREGEEEKLPRWYGLDLDGRVIMFWEDVILPYFDQGMLKIYIVLDDGTTEEMHIELVQGEPPIPTFLPEPVRIRHLAALYYLSSPGSTDMILCHNEPNWVEITAAKCYCLATEQVLEIPIDMVKSGEYYVCVSSEFMKTLEPVAYRFIFETAHGGEMDCLVLVRQNAGIAYHYFLFLSVELESYMPGIQGILSQAYSGRLTGVLRKQADGTEVELEPEWYNIACDGRYVFIKREYFMQYSTEEKISLIFTFDDGARWQEEITILE